MITEIDKLSTPAYVCEEELLEKNLQLLAYVKAESGAKIILALKAFALYQVAPLIDKYLDGCTASGLHEATLAHRHFSKEVHTYSPAFKEEEFDEIASISDHVVFNSTAQLMHYKDRVKGHISLRLNPEVSASPVDLYNPCAAYSRFGVTAKEFDPAVMQYVDGFNFHALCEQGSDELETVLEGLEQRFGPYLHQVKYVNFGGGHHITKEGYDVEKLIAVIKRFRETYNVDVYLEPGEAVGWETGYLLTTVLDVMHNGMPIAILDASAEAHMPDTLAMPYRAEVENAKEAGMQKITYRLAGNSCLAGDIMGDYSFETPLQIGQKLRFLDQMHYTFVKNTTFNGIPLPSLVLHTKSGEYVVLKEFGYEAYESRV